MKATPLLLCLACSALAAPPAKKQPEPAEPLPALEKNTIAIDGHPESVAADAEGNIYFTCIGSRLTVSGRLSLLHRRGHGLQDKRQDRRY